MITTILTYVVVGFIAGLLARAIMPGEDKMSWLWTIGLGIAGGLLAGFVWQAFGFYSPQDQTAGVIASTLGAIVILAIGRVIQARRHRHAHP